MTKADGSEKYWQLFASQLIKSSSDHSNKSTSTTTATRSHDRALLQRSRTSSTMTIDDHDVVLVTLLPSPVH